MKPKSHTICISFLILSLFCTECRQPNMPASVSINSKNDKVVSIVIRGTQIKEQDLSKRLVVRLIQPGKRSPVLGEFKMDKAEVMFVPLVPFTSGLQYEVLLDDSLFASIEIPESNVASPELLSIYPTQDTVPENLLKIYLQFSQPMVEGRSLTYITLVQNEKDTLKGTFLDLQPELWNAEGTTLTLWLDPGRIKRDLIPNKELGTPLNAGNKYTLFVSNSWKSKNGKDLLKDYSKTFDTKQRDDDSPEPTEWNILAPASGTKQFLEIQFRESLDYYILQEGIYVTNLEGDFISGTIELSNEEKTLKFFPDKIWSAGYLAVRIEARLEDLAGNNLNRPFERDAAEEIYKKDKEFFTKEFEIK